MELNDLLDGRRLSGYDARMSDRLWFDVGAELRTIRERAGYRSTNALAMSCGQRPTQKTMDAIERGRVGAVASLADYCQALRVTVRDVLAAAVARDPMPSPRAMSVARSFDLLPSDGQRALWSLVAALATPAPRATTPAAETREHDRGRPRSGGGRKRKTSA